MSPAEAATTEIEARVQRAEVSLVYAQARAGFAVSLFNGVVFFALLARVVPVGALAAWLALLVVVSAFRAVLVRAHARANARERDLESARQAPTSSSARSAAASSGVLGSVLFPRRASRTKWRTARSSPGLRRRLRELLLVGADGLLRLRGERPRPLRGAPLRSPAARSRSRWPGSRSSTSPRSRPTSGACTARSASRSAPASRTRICGAAARRGLRAEERCASRRARSCSGGRSSRSRRVCASSTPAAATSSSTARCARCSATTRRSPRPQRSTWLPRGRRAPARQARHRSGPGWGRRGLRGACPDERRP